MAERYYSEKEAAEYIKRKIGTLRNWRCQELDNGPKHLRDRMNKVVYRESDLIDFMEGKKNNGDSEE